MREGEALLARLEASQAEAEEQKARLITDIAALGAQLGEMEAAGSQERSQLLTRTLTLTRTRTLSLSLSLSLTLTLSLSLILTLSQSLTLTLTLTLARSALSCRRRRPTCRRRLRSSPRNSLYLPISPYISLNLPISP